MDGQSEGKSFYLTMHARLCLVSRYFSPKTTISISQQSDVETIPNNILKNHFTLFYFPSKLIPRPIQMQIHSYNEKVNNQFSIGMVFLSSEKEEK